MTQAVLSSTRAMDGFVLNAAGHEATGDSGRISWAASLGKQPAAQQARATAKVVRPDGAVTANQAYQSMDKARAALEARFLEELDHGAKQ